MDWETALWGGEEVENIITGTWRWGTTNQRIFRLDGKIYAVDYSLEPENGYEYCNDPEPTVYEVVPREKIITEWVKKEA